MGALHDYLERNGLAECEVSIFFLKLKIKANQNEKSASWTLFIELATRITTQNLDDTAGVEQTALNSLYEFFTISRALLAEKGRLAEDFSVLTIYSLNSVLRPFLSRWHKESIQNKAFENINECQKFRCELKILQKEMIALAFCLAEVADIEPDLTEKLLGV